ncbi:hypothetical protein U1Q18_041750 [Sarracenia purpurea var. burkii]
MPIYRTRGVDCAWPRQEEFSLFIVRYSLDIDPRGKIGGSLEACVSKIELAKIMPDETDFMEKRSTLESGRRNSDHVGIEEEKIRGDLPELGMFLANIGGGGSHSRDVGEVDAGVP